MVAALDSIKVIDADASATAVHTASIDHPSAWRVSDFRSPADFTLELTRLQLAEMSNAIRQVTEAGLARAFRASFLETVDR
jgi:hypothetical protein